MQSHVLSNSKQCSSIHFFFCIIDLPTFFLFLPSSRIMQDWSQEKRKIINHTIFNCLLVLCMISCIRLHNSQGMMHRKGSGSLGYVGAATVPVSLPRAAGQMHGWHHTGSARTAIAAQPHRSAKQKPREWPWYSKCRTQEVCKSTNLTLWKKITLGGAKGGTEGDPCKAGLLTSAVNKSGNFNYENHIIKYFSDTHPDFLFISWCFPSTDRVLFHYLSMLQ